MTSTPPTSPCPNPEVPPSLWLVDGYNVLRVSLAGSSPDWWNGEQRERLRELCGRFDAPAAEVVLVFDARHLEVVQESIEAGDATGARVVRTLFAPSADEWIVGSVRDEIDHRDEVFVVTADRRLAGRARSRGAKPVSTGDFLARCGSAPPPA